MIRFSPVLMLACLTACGDRLTPPSPAAPVPAELTAELSAPCPPLQQLADPRWATLARATDPNAALSDECRLRHAAVVNAYVESRTAIIRHNAEAAAKPGNAR